jgi:hypothetical protein
MTKKELLDYLTDGLDDEQAKAVRDAFKVGKVAERAETLRAAKEYDDLAARETALKAELEGGPEKPGAKAYREWYEKNYAAVVKLQQDKTELEAKLAAGGAAPADPAKPPVLTGLSKDDIERMVDARIQGGYAGRWGDLVTGGMSVVQKHILAGRKNAIDVAKLAKLAEANGGDLDKAYDEYDKPEREAAAKIAQDKLVEQRVNDELMKRGAHTGYPAGADMTPGILSRDRDSSKFDRAAMERDLVNTFISGEEGGGKLTGFGVN